MRTALLRRHEDKFAETERSYSQLSQGDRLRELLDELHRSEQKNATLETEIGAKSRELSDLRLNLRRIMVEGHDAQKRLKELRESTAAIQQSLTAMEHSYQEEIEVLRAQLSLEGSDRSRELQEIDEALRAQSADRKAAYAFADDAQVAALKEIEQQEERLRAAEQVVKTLEGLVISSQSKSSQLGKSRAALAEEVATLRMKKRQLESRVSTNEIMGTNREAKLRKMLQEAKAQLEAANLRIEAQSEQIRSKQKEIGLLQEEIDVHQKGIINAQSRFLQSVSPKKGRGRDRAQTSLLE
jgi:predicted  nucleic acid-binding Zn-ribbon protein